LCQAEQMYLALHTIEILRAQIRIRWVRGREGRTAMAQGGGG
jgi:hypothetical protein